MDTAESNNPVNYIYFRKYDKNYNFLVNGGLGVGWVVVENDYIKIAFSICHEKDRFIKNISREIILKRLFGETDENDKKYILKLNKEFLSLLINKSIKPKYLLKDIEINLEDISNKFIINLIKSYMSKHKQYCQYC